MPTLNVWDANTPTNGLIIFDSNNNPVNVTIDILITFGSEQIGFGSILAGNITDGKTAKQGLIDASVTSKEASDFYAFIIQGPTGDNNVFVTAAVDGTPSSFSPVNINFSSGWTVRIDLSSFDDPTNLRITI